MARFESLKPEPDPGPYDIVVDGERVERVNPNNGDSEIVLQTTTTTETNRVNTSVSFSSAEYTGRSNGSYNPKSLGSPDEQWHNELDNIEAHVYASTSDDYETGFCRMTLKFENKDRVEIDCTAEKGSDDRWSGRAEDSITIDSGTLTGIEIDGSHKYCNHCVDYQTSNASITADVPVDETIADITAADVR